MTFTDYKLKFLQQKNTEIVSCRNSMEVQAGLDRESYLKLLACCTFPRLLPFGSEMGVRSLFCPEQFKIIGALHFEGDQGSERAHWREILNYESSSNCLKHWFFYKIDFPTFYFFSDWVITVDQKLRCFCLKPGLPFRLPSSSLFAPPLFFLNKFSGFPRCWDRHITLCSCS